MFFNFFQGQPNLPINSFQQNKKKEIPRFTSSLILFAILGSHFSSVQAVDLTWKTPQSGNWSDPNNWAGGSPANPPYNATINNTGFKGAIVDRNFGGDVQNFNFNGGTVNTASNILKVNKTFNWTRGTLAGTGAIHAAGGLELGGNGSMVFKDSAMVVNKAGQVANWNNNNIQMSFSGNSGFVNEAGAFFNAKVDNGSMGVLSGRGKFDNLKDGVFVTNLSGPGQFTTINAKMNNHGTVAALAGELRLSGGGTSTGTFVSIGQGKINFSGGVHDLQAGSSISGENVEFGRFLGTTNIAGAYEVNNTTITGGATVNFNKPGFSSTMGTLTMDGPGLQTLGGSGHATVVNQTTFRNGILQGTTAGTGGQSILNARGGVKLDGPGVKVIRGQKLLVLGTPGGPESSWDKGSIILRDAPTEESGGSDIFNQSVLRIKAVGGAMIGPGRFIIAGPTVIELPEIYADEAEGELRQKVLIKSDVIVQDVLVLQGGNLRIGGELEEGNIFNNNPVNEFNGNLTVTDAGLLLYEIAGNERAMTYDTLDVFKIAILDGGALIKLVDDILNPNDSAEAFKPKEGDKFYLIVAGEIIDNGIEFGGPDGHQFIKSIEQLASGEWALTATYVPIPASIWLFMSALFGIWRIKVRQSR